MSSVNYSLKHRGVRLVTAEEAWVRGKNGKRRLNPNYSFVGKVDTKLPNAIVTVSENRQPSFKGDFAELNRTAKDQTVRHFYDQQGKRNRRTVAYFGIEKSKKAGSATKSKKKK